MAAWWEPVVNGRQELVSLRIDPEVVVAEDVEMLQDLILAALNEALNRPWELMAAEMRTHWRHEDSGMF